MTDTPVTPQTFPPPSRLELIKAFIGDLARPFAIIASSGSASIATVIIAAKVDGFEGAGIFIGAVYAGVAGLYAGKAWENVRIGKQTAEVEVAKAATPVAAQPGPDAPPWERKP